jgi:hypothetical protein
VSREANHCEDGERLERIEGQLSSIGEEQSHHRALMEQGAEHIRNLAGVADDLRRVIGHDSIREAMGVKLRERVGLVGAISELRESQNELTRKVDKIQRGQERLELRLERSEDESENTAIQSRQEIVERARRAEQRAEEEREARLRETKADAVRWFRLVVILLSSGGIVAAILKAVL